jgi:hypothetical protein
MDSNREGRIQTIPICIWHDPVSKRPKSSTKKLLEIINFIGKVEDTKLAYRNQ